MPCYLSVNFYSVTEHFFCILGANICKYNKNRKLEKDEFLLNKLKHEPNRQRNQILKF
jgi:hypothetical protein